MEALIPTERGIRWKARKRNETKATKHSLEA